MRWTINPGDRVHMIVWRPWGVRYWCAAPAINGVPIDFANRYPSWVDALEAALEAVR